MMDLQSNREILKDATAITLKIKDAALALGVHPDTLRRWDRAGKLKPARDPMSGFRVYRLHDLQELLARREG